MAIESGDVVMLTDNLAKLPHLIKLSRNCKRRVIENIAMTITIKLVFVILALTDTVRTLWIAILVDAVSILLVMANSARGSRALVGDGTAATAVPNPNDRASPSLEAAAGAEPASASDDLLALHFRAHGVEETDDLGGVTRVSLV